MARRSEERQLDFLDPLIADAALRDERNMMERPFEGFT